MFPRFCFPLKKKKTEGARGSDGERGWVFLISMLRQVRLLWSGSLRAHPAVAGPASSPAHGPAIIRRFKKRQNEGIMNSALRLYRSHQCVCRRLISGLTDEKYPCQNNSNNDKSERSTPFTAAQKLSEKKVHWCQKKKGGGNNGLGFWASLYLQLVTLQQLADNLETQRGN